MSDRPKVSVEIDGQAREIELPEGFLPEADIRDKYVPKESVESLVQERVGRAKKGRYTPDELMEDEEFIERFAKSKAEQLREKLGIKGKPDDQQVEALRKQIEEQMVAPLSKQVEGYKAEVTKLRQRSLDAEVGDAAGALGVHEDLVELVRVWARDRVDHDEEHGWVVLKAPGEPEVIVAEDGKTIRPKRVQDLLAELKRTGERKSWFKDETRGGIGIGGPGKGGSSHKPIADMSEADKMAFIRENGQEAYLKLLAENRRKA